MTAKRSRAGVGGAPRKRPQTPAQLAEPSPPLDLFEPKHAELAYQLCLLGADNARVAAIFGITAPTFERWRKEFPEFDSALKRGKDEADGVIALSLYGRAKGYSHQAVKIFCDPKTGAREIVDYVEHYPPDTTACIFWLKNRRPDLWRDRIEHTGKDGGAIKTEQTLKVDALAPDDRDVLRSLLQAAMPEDERDLAARREKMQ